MQNSFLRDSSEWDNLYTVIYNNLAFEKILTEPRVKLKSTARFILPSSYC